MGTSSGLVHKAFTTSLRFVGFLRNKQLQSSNYGALIRGTGEQIREEHYSSFLLLATQGNKRFPDKCPSGADTQCVPRFFQFP
jgi:hypothetical protein